MRAGDNVGDDFGILGIWDRGFENADDGGRPIAHGPAAEPDGFAEDGRIFLESGRPETIREDDHARRFGTVVLRSDETAKDRVEAHDFELGAANDASSTFARLTHAAPGETAGPDTANPPQAFNTHTQI